MRIAIGSDSMGFTLKKVIEEFLCTSGYLVTDYGTKDQAAPVIYIEAADAVCRAVSDGTADFGIVICRTGMGVSMIANKHCGIRAALCESVYTARESRRINDSNVLAIGKDVVSAQRACEIVQVYLDTPFADGEPDSRRELLSSYLSDFAAFEKKVFLHNE